MNIIELNYATVELLNELVFRVSCLDRNYDFKAVSSFERDLSLIIIINFFIIIIYYCYYSFMLL